MKNTTTSSKSHIATSNSISTRLNSTFKIILFAVASIFSGISGAFAQGVPNVDVTIAAPYQDGSADTSVNIKACFVNTSTTLSDRINISAISSNGWVVALYDTNYYELLGFDVNGDGTWDYVNSRFDFDMNGQPDTKVLAPGEKQCLNFKVFIPVTATVGTIDTLQVYGFSMANKNISDMQMAFIEVTAPVVLPVELLFFSAGLNGKVVSINWLSATEINNDFYSVERSADGIDFEEILVVRGAGNSNSIIRYAIEDKTPLKGISYYRLTQTDYDGKSETFNVVVVNNGSVAQTINIQQNAYPNPFTESFTLGYNVETSGTVTATITDITGRVHSTESLIATKGYNDYSFNGNKLPKGMYFLTFTYNENVITAKLSKTTDY